MPSQNCKLAVLTNDLEHFVKRDFGFYDNFEYTVTVSQISVGKSWPNLQPASTCGRDINFKITSYFISISTFSCTEIEI